MPSNFSTPPFGGMVSSSFFFFFYLAMYAQGTIDFAFSAEACNNYPFLRSGPRMRSLFTSCSTSEIFPAFLQSRALVCLFFSFHFSFEPRSWNGGQCLSMVLCIVPPLNSHLPFYFIFYCHLLAVLFPPCFFLSI
jgi:hypothetical protein